VLDEEFGQADRPELEAEGVLGLLAVGGDDFRRAAADVDEQRAIGGGRPLEDAQADEAGLLGAAHHLDVDSRLGARGPQEVVAIRRFPHGARGHGADVARPRGVRELGETDQRLGAGGN